VAVMSAAELDAVQPAGSLGTTASAPVRLGAQPAGSSSAAAAMAVPAPAMSAAPVVPSPAAVPVVVPSSLRLLLPLSLPLRKLFSRRRKLFSRRRRLVLPHLHQAVCLLPRLLPPRKALSCSVVMLDLPTPDWQFPLAREQPDCCWVLKGGRHGRLFGALLSGRRKMC
jgi:hypothetical protein